MYLIGLVLYFLETFHMIANTISVVITNIIIIIIIIKGFGNFY